MQQFIRRIAQRPSRHDIDMLNGSILPKVLTFAWPLMLTGILQLLFNAADIIVVGNYAENGADALAAVSSTSALINLLVNLFMGLSIGASVAVARGWGSRDDRSVSRAVHTAIALAGIAGIAVGVAGFFLSGPLLVLMGNTDARVGPLATLYMKIYFGGMLFNMLYNFGAAVLRAVGDTRRPLMYLTVAGVANVLLNLLLVIRFGLGVEGVAIATVVSQGISCVLVLLCLRRSTGALHLDVRRLRIHREQLLDILRVGLPAGLQSSLFSISNVLIQSTVNSFGTTAMAGSGAAGSLEGFVYTSMNSIYQADLTFASQNYGAGKPDRVRRTMWVCLGTVAALGLALGLLFWAFGRQLLAVYINVTPEEEAAVIGWGLRRMAIIMPTYFLCGMMDSMVGQLRAVGCSVLPMISSLTGVCLLRVVWILAVVQPMGPADPRAFDLLFLSYPMTWLVTFLVHMASWQTVGRRLLRRIEPAGVQ